LYSMKKKITMLGIITILIVAMLYLVGCSCAPNTSQTTTPPTKSTSQSTSAATTSTSKTTPAATTSAAKTTSAATTTSNQASGGSVADLLGRAASVASMKFDMVTTAPDNSVTTSTAYVKKNKMRAESNMQGQNTVMLIDGDAKTMYMYTPAQNTAIKMDFSQAPQPVTGSSVSQYNPTIVGSETLDGKLCQILQYTANGAVTKEWVWDAKGLPVRIQTTTSAGTSTIDFKNYDFSDIPDSMFVLPEGVQITSFGLPTGLPTNLPTNLPSNLPTNLPSGFPTNLPTNLPTNVPTGIPYE
jgi:outer membrane lipoprotein-sorting protein